MKTLDQEQPNDLPSPSEDEISSLNPPRMLSMIDYTEVQINLVKDLLRQYNSLIDEINQYQNDYMSSCDFMFAFFEYRPISIDDLNQAENFIIQIVSRTEVAIELMSRVRVILMDLMELFPESHRFQTVKDLLYKAEVGISINEKRIITLQGMEQSITIKSFNLKS